MPTRIPGYAEHRELELMVAAGLTPIEAIHCATQVNAQLLQITSQTGTIAAGKQADLILLSANPADNIQNTRKIAHIWHNGRTVEPAIAIAAK
jgi:imidazolonepropionase-like amidohydrolase